MASPFDTGQLTNATDVAVQKYFKKDADVKLHYKSYYNYRTTEDLIEQDAGISGLSEAVFTAENAQVTEDSPVETNKKSYTQQQVEASATYTYLAYVTGISKRRLKNISKDIT